MCEQNAFEILSADQLDELKTSVALITILISGADDQIDEQELNWAEKLTHIRSYTSPDDLNTFYSDVVEGFSEQVSKLIATLPTDTGERQKIISARLSAVNDILAILDNKLAYRLYESFTSFAEHIAKASGGFLRFGSISAVEKKWVSLPMLHPIILEEDPEVK